MKCTNCKASHIQYYAESYECDWYCLAGVQDEERIEKADGQLGCNLHYKTIQKRIDDNEKAWLKEKEEYIKWIERKEKEE